METMLEECLKSIDEFTQLFEPEDRDAACWHIMFDILRELKKIVKANKASTDPVDKHWKSLYREYIHSKVWTERTEIMRGKFDNRCQICNKSGKSKSLHVHHRTYERLGLELPEDLTVLCAGCHAKFHDKLQY